MGRIVEMDAGYPAWPRWLAQARSVATALEALGGAHDPIAEHAIFERAGLNPNMARRYVRLYQFLVVNFQSWLDGRPLAAGSTAIRELATLHGCNPTAANRLAPDVLTGKLRDVDIKRETNAFIAKGTNVTPPGRLGITRRIFDFERSARQQIAKAPEKLGIGPVDDLTEPDRGQPLTPDLVAYQAGRAIAIEFKAAGAGATTYIAGSYLARLAQLRERYDDAVLVLPAYCAELAEVASDLQFSWSGTRPHICLIDT